MSVERLRCTRGAAAAAAVMLSTAVPALADPISIVSGSVFYSRQNEGQFEFKGDGFRAQGQLGPDGGWYPDYVCFTCEPGTPINVSHSEALPSTSVDPFAGVGGRFELEGVLYDIDSIHFDIDAGEVTVVGGFTDTTPFLFRGMLTGTPVGGTGSAEVSLTGSGTARLLFGGATLDHGWFESQYRFADPSAPIPEPGTLLLFGTGAAAALARRRKRANQARA